MKEGIPLSRAEMILGTISGVCVSLIAYIAIVLGRLKQQTIEKFERKPTFRVEERVGGKADGAIILIAETKSLALRPGGGVEPPRTCDELLVVNFVSPLATEGLAKKLEDERMVKKSGVERAVALGPFTIVVERPCRDRHESLWPWQKVWESIRPTIMEEATRKE